MSGKWKKIFLKDKEKIWGEIICCIKPPTESPKIKLHYWKLQRMVEFKISNKDNSSWIVIIVKSMYSNLQREDTIF